MLCKMPVRGTPARERTDARGARSVLAFASHGINSLSRAPAAYISALCDTT